MSVKVMGAVWELDLPHSKRLVLLAMADKSQSELTLEFIAWLTGYSKRQTRRILNDLERNHLVTCHPEMGIYTFDLSQGKKKRPYEDFPRPKKNKLRKHLAKYHDTLFVSIGKRDGFRCACCNTTETLQIDHVKPISKGGDNSLGNLQLLCLVCNLRKGTKEIDYRASGGAK